MKLRKLAKPALYYKDRAYSYSEFIDTVQYFASVIPAGPQDRVVICSENRPEWYFSFYGVWHCNACAVAVDYLSSEEEIAYILSDATPRVVLVSAEVMEKMKKAVTLSACDAKIVCIDDVVKPADFTAPLDELEFTDSDDTSIMIYTSGTTGKPKGVMLSKKNIAANVYGISKLKMFQESDVYGAILPFHHIYPLTGTVVMPLVFGSSVVIIEKLSSDVIIGAFQKYGVTTLFGIPRLYTLFHKGIMDKIHSSAVARIIFGIAKMVPSRAFRKVLFGTVQRKFGGKVRYFLSGGSKIDDKVMEDFGVLGFHVTEGYGLSETSPLNSANNSPGIFKKGTIGKALCNVDVKIIDGEICVRGDHVMKGYYNKPAETAEVIKDGWFYTGDAGFMDKKGFITITGRKRELIVLPNGKKVNPEEIETKIKSLHPDMIKEIGVFSKDNGLYAIVHPDFEFLKNNNLVNIFETVRWQVIDKYNRASRDFKKVLNFKIVPEELPKTRIGKLKRFMFPALLDSDVQETVHPDDPDTEEYAVLKKKLSELTGVRVYPDSALELDLGLDSLAKIELDSFIENTYGVSVTANDISGSTKVLELFELIQSRKTESHEKTDTNWGTILKDARVKKPGGNGIVISLIYVFSYIYLRMYLGLKVRGRKNVPRSPAIYTPNHQSFLDALLFYSALPGYARRNVYFTANEKHFKNGLARFVAFSSHVILVNINYNLRETLQRIAALIKSGKSVVIFPEGARTRDGSLMEFKKLFAILSKELSVPVVPVTIQGAFEAMPVDSRFPHPAQITVEFFESIAPDSDDDYDAVTQKVRLVVAKALEKQ